MESGSGIIVLLTAVGSVAFLLGMDHFYRIREQRAEMLLAQAEEETRPQPYIEISEESDEPHLAA